MYKIILKILKEDNNNIIIIIDMTINMLFDFNVIIFYAKCFYVIC
jgi:hypothetical protein